MEFLKFSIKISHVLEGRFIGVETLMNFKLLMLLERLVTAFEVTLLRKLSYHWRPNNDSSAHACAEILVMVFGLREVPHNNKLYQIHKKELV